MTEEPLVTAIRHLEALVDPAEEIHDPRFPRPVRPPRRMPMFAFMLVAALIGITVAFAMGWRLVSPDETALLASVRAAVPDADNVSHNVLALRAIGQLNAVRTFSSLVQAREEDLSAYQRLPRSAPLSFSERRMSILETLLTSLSAFKPEDAAARFNRLLALADIQARDPGAFTAVQVLSEMPPTYRAELFAPGAVTLKTYVDLAIQAEVSRGAYRNAFDAIKDAKSKLDQANRDARSELAATQVAYAQQQASMQRYSRASAFLQSCVNEAWARESASKAQRP